MWAVGCVIIELLTRQRLRESLWDDGVEVSGRREQLIGLVEGEDKDLGAIVRDLLHPDKNFRLNALILKSRLCVRAQIARHSPFSANGRLLASGSADHTIRLWDPTSGSGQRTLTGHSDG